MAQLLLMGVYVKFTKLVVCISGIMDLKILHKYFLLSSQNPKHLSAGAVAACRLSRNSRSEPLPTITTV